MNRLMMMGLATACVAGGAQANTSESQNAIQYVEVGPELKDCVGVAKTKCMQVRRFGTQEWQFFHGGIEGFSYEEGHTYLLKIKEQKVENPPADASSIRWMLEQVVSDKDSLARMLKPFPAAKSGQVRWIIDLPALPDEDSSKVELLPGKRMLVDCNLHRGGSVIEERTLDGWGYGYYVMESVGPIASTMMGCMDPEKTEQFVSVGSLNLQRYNSRLPIVFYAPEEVELRYRLWKTDGSEQLATQQ